MPIDYTSTTGSLQVRLGKIISTGKDLRSQQGSTLTNIEEVRAQYTATTLDRVEYLGRMASMDAEGQVDMMARPLQEVVRESVHHTVLQTVRDGLREVPDIDTALRVLAVDMIAQGQSIPTTNVVIGTVGATAQGSGTMILSSAGKFAYSGAKYTAKPSFNDAILPETINAYCTKDARDGSLIRGNERWLIEGKAAVDRLDRRWQDGTANYGSGAVLQINSTCGAIENSGARGQNMLSNSGFERVNGTPFALDWVIAAGTEGTTLQSSTTAARGSRSMRFVGDNTVVHNIYEIMGQGPRPNVKANTVYIVSALLRGDGGTVNTGTLRLGLRDSANAEISGAGIIRALNTDTVASTGWTRMAGAFVTPLDLPSEVRFSVSFTVKLGNQTLLVDEVVLIEAAQIYPGGLYAAVVAGTADWELDDRLSSAITKTAAEWQVELDRYLDLAGRGVQLPTSTSPTFASTHIG